MNIYLIKIQKKEKKFSTDDSERGIFLKKILAKETGNSINSIEIGTGEFGKPFLRNVNRHFNISYSQDLIAIATDKDPIGIDIEFIKPINDIDLVIDHFSEKEKRFLSKKNHKDKVNSFYALWVLKESYVKAIGKGLYCPLDSFTIKFLDEKITLLNSPIKDEVWHFKKYSSQNGYVFAICAKHKNFPNEITIINTNEMLDSGFN